MPDLSDPELRHEINTLPGPRSIGQSLSHMTMAIDRRTATRSMDFVVPEFAPHKALDFYRLKQEKHMDAERAENLEVQGWLFDGLKSWTQ
jgi:hypothetical protein